MFRKVGVTDRDVGGCLRLYSRLAWAAPVDLSPRLTYNFHRDRMHT
jgi:hypothetical protein